jgi:periplasmic divalent cation tolerance protein
MKQDPTPYVLVITTCADRDSAVALAGALVESRLAACVNVVDGVTSIYSWKGSVERDPECLLLVKTRRELFDRLREEVRLRHPYELPEVIAVPVQDGLSGYLRWIDESLDLET